MRTFSTVVIGGGAAGLVAAISAARAGSRVIVCEKTRSAGRKILASGNGRCNLSNDDLTPSRYNPASRSLVRSVLSRFDQQAIRDFFAGLGLRLRSEDGRIFPATNQSASVLRALELELERLAVPVECHCDITEVSRRGNGFAVTARSGAHFEAGSVILTGGGRSYPALGSDGSAYKLAQELGHTLIDPVPVCVPLNVKDPLCHMLQGQKIRADVSLHGARGRVRTVSGDLLFTKYGLSGTAILDISRDVSIALNRDRSRNLRLSVDMVPFLPEKELVSELGRRIGGRSAVTDMLVGLLPNRFGPALSSLFKARDAESAAHELKNRVFTVQGTRGWNEAEFTAGGIDTSEADHGTLESRIVKGLYIAGEVLDVDGERGGYNLAWAWASGYVAGEASAHA